MVKIIFQYLFVLCIFTSVISCSTQTKKYPEHWWQNTTKEEQKSWEVMPGAVRFPQVILSKRNELGLLSNFAETPFVFNNKKFASIEGFWQSTKFPEDSKDPRFSLASWPMTRKQVEGLSGFAAKRAGDFASQVMKKNKIDWVSFNGKKMVYKEKGESEFYYLIFSATQEKVKQNENVRSLLQSTGELELLPDHKQELGVPLAWQYYKIYEKIRDEL